MNPSIEEYRIGIMECADKVKLNYPNLSFDWAGIIPTFSEDDKYWCTPLNTKMIARTGGDGVHFSVLEISKEINPVVITIPCTFGNETSDYNIILGESIREFLGIGAMEGWFPLEQIVYQGEKFIESYGSTELVEILPEYSDGYFIKMLLKYFKIEKVKLKRERLTTLKEQYFDKLDFSDEFIEMIKPKS